MVKLLLKNIYKIYPSRDKGPSIFKRLFSKNKEEKPKDFVAVKDFNLEIEDGEFVVFVGPSGCGKSTTLRMIAGLEDISAGELYLDGQLLNNVDAMNRDMAMVFQSYALYPHLSAYDNIAFGLKIRKIEEKYTDDKGVEKVRKRHLTKQEIDEKVQWAAEILDIKQLLNRKPSEMSGGQCQRVALGRAIVRGPKVFLLDEPLSNLDAKLRTSMRSEIVKLHQRLKTTFIYVTHDQVEAMTMGNKIVVMKDGVIQQVDKPTDLFQYPVNQFVAGFIGTPQMNFFNVTIQLEDKKSSKLLMTFENGESVSLDINKMRKIEEKFLDGEAHEVILGLRAEHILLQEKGIHLYLSVSEILGSYTHLFAHFENASNDYIISINEVSTLESGTELTIGFNEDKIHLFDSESKQSILEGKK
ncbi:MAG: ABC transporter ATP-binding protein [Bacilli bacterium]|nr:ABC transporter ATP-binding protein [Bacilli bacterium]